MVKLVGEIATNHNGSIDTAIAMADALHRAGFWAVKGQYRTPDPAWKDKPYDHVSYSFGKTYWDHRQAVDLTRDEHAKLRNYCLDLGMEYYVSVWDQEGVEFASSLSPWIKVPSAMNMDDAVLQAVAQAGSKAILSAGMIEAVPLVRSLRILGTGLAYLLVTTCSYPARNQDLNLARLETVRSVKDGQYQVGLSGHHQTIEPDLIAVGLGARMIERHITFNKGAKGPDHGMSLDLGEASVLGSGIREAVEALGNDKLELLEAEKPFARKVGRITEE